MGLKSGNKGRYYRERRKRNVRRAQMRALRKTLQTQATAPTNDPKSE
jgi:hypothetical protein